MAVIFGLQMIENGIEDKLLNEHKAIPSHNDLCKKYHFGTKNSNIKSTEVRGAIFTAIRAGEVDELVRLIVFYMCQTIFFSKTGNFGLPCNFLVLVKSVDVINRISWPRLIHNAMIDGIVSSKGNATHITGCSFYLLYWFAEHSSLERRPGNCKVSRELTIPVDVDYEHKLTSPTKQMSRLEISQQRALKLDMENICLIEEMDGMKKRIHKIHMKFRIERNRLRAKGIREKVDVSASISQLMLTTFDEIINELAGDSGNHEQVQLELPRRSDTVQEGEASKNHKPDGTFQYFCCIVFTFHINDKTIEISDFHNFFQVVIRLISNLYL
ncbi:hypothetical protein MKW94_027447 [Papaver nudicaule]|uniref:Aminotransferase-like plant mobile domain-containing protein n=1 Tax=Papaver nudicaule TaxID=74823 RepID=A0AA42B0E2_PAPNU|nr:hypothetical protein [Papaver nudicaule]